MSDSSANALAQAAAPGRPRWLRWILYVAAALIALFVALVAAAWIFGPPLAKRAFEENFAARTGRKAAVGEVSVQPLRLGVTAKPLRIEDAAGGPPLLEVETISLRLSLASLWNFAIVIDDYLMVRPKVHVVRLERNRFSFSDVVDRLTATPKAEEAKQGPPFPVKIRNIRIEDGRLDYEDRVVGQKHAVTELAFHLPVFSNLPREQEDPIEPSLAGKLDGSPFSLKARTRLLGAARESEGTAEVTDLVLPRYFAFLPVALPVTMPGGRISAKFTGATRVPLEGAFELRGNGEVDIVDVALDEKGGGPLFRAPRTVIKLGELALPEQRVEVTSVVVERPVLNVRRAADGSINLQTIAGVAAGGGSKAVGAEQGAAPAADRQTGAAAATGQAAPKPPAAPAASGSAPAAPAAPAWSVSLGEAKVTGGTVDFADAAVAPPVRMQLRDIEVAVAGLRSAKGSEATYTVSLATDAGEQVATRGKAVLVPLAVDGELQAGPVKLPRYAAYLGPAGAALADGSASANTRYRFASEGKEIRLTALEAKLESVRLRDPSSGQDVLVMPQLALRGADVDVGAGAVKVAGVQTQFNVRDPGARLEILEVPQVAAEAIEFDNAAQRARIGSVAARLRVNDPGTRRAVAELSPITVRQVDVDLGRRVAKIAGVAISRAGVEVVREKDGTSNVDRLLAAGERLTKVATRLAGGGSRAGMAQASRADAAKNPAAAAARATPAAHATPAAGGAASRGSAPAKSAPAAGTWRVDVAQLRVERLNARGEDRVPEPPLVVSADPVSLGIDGFSTARGAKMKVALRGTVNGTGKVDVSGRTSLSPPEGELQVGIVGLDFSPAQRYLGELLNVAIRSGAVNAKGALRFALPPDQPPRVEYAGDAGVVDFGSVTAADGEDFLNWKSLSAVGVKAAYNGEQGPLAVDIDTVTLSDFFSRLIVFEDGRLNVQQILAKPGNDPTLPAAELAPAAKGTQAPRRGPRITFFGRSGKGPTVTGAGSGKDIGMTRPTGAPPIRIGRIVLERGRVDVTDRFVRPNYQAELAEVNGTVEGLSSAFDSRADVFITGRYHQTAPVEVKGTINPLRGDLFLDLTAKASDIDLPPFTPYSQKYTGYGITKGKLTIGLKYFIEKQQLEAENRLFVDQLTFGEKVESPSATKLPVLLAVALLKNPRGEIDINLPISGSIDDPEFSVGGLIIQVIVNMLTKAATAPFALIASLAGGKGEELSWIEFQPGTATFAAGQEAKLASLAKALGERPGVKLDVAGRADRATDLAGVKARAVDRRIKARRQAEIVKAGGAAPPVDEIVLTPADRERLLAQVYAAEAAKTAKPPAAAAPAAPAAPTAPAARAAPAAPVRPAGPAAPAMPGAAPGTPGAAPAAAPAAAPSAADMEAALLAAVEVGDEEFRALAERRAREVKEELVRAGVAGERVFVVSDLAVGDEAKTRGAARADLSLK